MHLAHVGIADGDHLRHGYFAGLEDLVRHAVCEAELADAEIIHRGEQSLKRLFPHLASAQDVVPPDLTISSPRDERTRFYHHEYQHKLLNGVYEFILDYAERLDRRHLVIVDNAHALSPTVRSFLRLLVRRRGLLERVRVALLLDEDRLDVAIAQASRVVRFEPMDLGEARALAQAWTDGDVISPEQFEQRWLLSKREPGRSRCPR